MTHKPRMLAIGTATQDVFIRGGKVFTPVCTNDGKCYEHLPLGAKLDVEEVIFSTGGNAMNAAVTFARQGLDSEFMGVIGVDPAGQVVLQALDHEGVDTRNLVQHEHFTTGYSTILLAPSGERTILRQHSKTVQDNGEPLELEAIAHANWLYLSSVGSLPLLHKMITIAAQNGVQVAFNPGTVELSDPHKLRAVLEDVSILLVNKDEAKLIVEGETPEELLRHATHLVPTVVISDGPNGVIATDGKTIVQAGMYDDVPVLDRTGAGDAFGSGFVSMIAQGKSLQEAVVFASANSTSVVGKIGATAGILHHDVRLHAMPLTVRPFEAATEHADKPALEHSK